MGLKQTVPPISTPITLQEAKDHMYVTISDDDTLITSMINSATKLLEDYTGLQLQDSTYIQTLDKWEDVIILKKSPVSAISSIKYYDENNDLQTLDPSVYQLDDFQMPNRLVQNESTSLPNLKNRVNAIEITYIAGYESFSVDTPENLLSWIKIQVGNLYENREEFAVTNLNEIPNRFVDRLLDSYKVL